MEFVVKSPNPPLQFRNLTRRQTTSRIIIHHTHEEWDAATSPLHRIHLMHKNNGWAGIGYHYYVTLEGVIWEGRPHYVIGSHTANNNGDSVGIAFQGRYDCTRTKMPDEQFDAGIHLLNYLEDIYGPLQIIGHRDASPSACPGRHFPLKEMRARYFRNPPNVELPFVPTPERPFKDVPEGHWSETAFREMYARKLVSGFGDGRVGFGEPVPFERIIQLLWNMVQQQEGDGK